MNAREDRPDGTMDGEAAPIHQPSKAPEDPILFRTPEEFRARPGFIETLAVVPGELSRIVGKYHFASTAMIKCGLNGCTQMHARGFVVRTKDGRETNCGKDCGRREFGQEFEQFEATYKALEDALGRRTAALKLLEQRGPLLAQAEDLLGSVSSLAQGLRGCVDCIERDPALARAFIEAVRMRGQIRREQAVDDDLRKAMSMDMRRSFEVVETFAGSEAIEGFRLAASNLSLRVVEPLRGLAMADMQSMKQRQFDALSRSIDNMARDIAAAVNFQGAARAFLESANLAKLRALTKAMRGKDITSRTDRALAGLVALRVDST